jgi:hypothetical protein
VERGGGSRYFSGRQQQKTPRKLRLSAPGGVSVSGNKQKPTQASLEWGIHYWTGGGVNPMKLVPWNLPWGPKFQLNSAVPARSQAWQPLSSG